MIRTRLSLPLHLLAGACLLSGCASQSWVQADALVPGATFSSSEVQTAFGDYRFDRVTVAPDSLIGEYRVEVQRRSSEHGVYYEDVVRKRGIALDDVVAVSTKKRDAERTLFIGVGTFAAVVVMRDVFDSEVLRTGGGSSKTKADPAGR